MIESLPVLIVGAGPTGLSMAIELSRFKIPFRIIDKKNEPVATSNALVVQTRTLEMWDDIGFLNNALSKGKKLSGLEFYANKKLLGSLDANGLKTLHPYVLGLAQSDTEHLLLAYLRDKSVAIEFNTELTGLKEVNGGYSITLKKNGQEENVDVTWLLAADGGHSTIRQLINMPFEGKDLPQHFVMGDVKITSPFAKNKPTAFFSQHGTAMIIPFSEDYSRILFEVSKDEELRSETKPTTAQLKKLLDVRSQFDIQIDETKWTSGFWIHEKIIPQYRSKQIFFLGDAAHVHSPAGGQGMNTGIQDVYNLGWKLASVIKGEAEQTLLDTYHEERRPVAKGVLARSTFLTKSGTAHSNFVFYLRNLILPIILKTKLASKFLAINSQLSIHYRDSSLSKECLKSEPGPRAGDRFLDCWINEANQESLLSHIKGCASILLFSGILRDTNLPQILEILKALTKDYSHLLKVVIISATPSQSEYQAEIIQDEEQKIHRTYQVTIPRIYFIRSDKYLGFRGKLSDYDTLLEYLKNIYSK